MARLTRIWEDHGRPCGPTAGPQLLAPLIRGILDFRAALKEPAYGSSAEHKALQVTVSEAQIDRLLAPARKTLELRGISTTRATGASLPSPVQTHFDWKAVQPGDFAFDTAVPRLPGSFARP